MKKIYNAPKTDIVVLTMNESLLEGSNVKTGGVTGEEYVSTDVSYVREHHSIWDEEE